MILIVMLKMTQLLTIQMDIKIRVAMLLIVHDVFPFILK